MALAYCIVKSNTMDMGAHANAFQSGRFTDSHAYRSIEILKSFIPIILLSVVVVNCYGGCMGGVLKS